MPGKRGVIDFDNPYKGRVGDDELTNKYKGKKVGFNGDYKVPKDFQDAIEATGAEFLQYAEDNGIDLVAYGFDINGDGAVGPKEAGAGCTAFALEHGMRIPPGKTREEIASIFNDGHFTIRKALKGENWKAAEQILGDNWPHEVKKPTNTDEADKEFVSKYKASGNSGLLGGNEKF